MNRVTAPLAAALLAAPLTAAPPQRAAAPARPSRSPLELDVAGIRLAMPTAQARAALAAAGYRCREGRRLSFRQLALTEVSRRRGRYDYFPDGEEVGTAECEGPGGEQLGVDFAQTPSGGIVNSVTLKLPAGRVDLAAARAALAERFGRPTVGTAENGTWCGARCGLNGYPGEIPHVGVQSSAAGILVVAVRGDAAFRADKTAVEREADRLAPPARPTF